MASAKSLVARKAAKATAKHTAHGVVSKAQRQPVRAVTLLSVGGIIGAVLSLLAQRKLASPPPPAPVTPTPAPTPTATKVPPESTPPAPADAA